MVQVSAMEMNLLLAHQALAGHTFKASDIGATYYLTCNPWIDLHPGFCARHYNACFDPIAIWCAVYASAFYRSLWYRDSFCALWRIL